MKKRLVVLLIIVLILMICACNSSPESSQTPSPEPWQGGALDLNEPYYADGLNDYGLPDLSVYSADQIWDMFTHPENWTADVLNMADTTFDFSEEEDVYSDPDINEDYYFEFSDWHDYDPGTWTPGAEEFTEFDIDWSEFDDSGYTPPQDALPAEYAFLVPGGLRENDVVINDEDGLSISLKGRTSEEYAAVVQAAINGGYTQDADSNEMIMPYYSANNGIETINIAYYQGSVMITFEDVDTE